MKTYAGNPNLPPEFVALKTKLSPEWEDHTLADAEEYRISMAQNSSLAKYALYLKEGIPGSIYLVWGVPNHAIRFVVAAMNSEFLQHHRIEEVTINGVNLEEYKREHYISSPDLEFTLISQVSICC